MLALQREPTRRADSHSDTQPAKHVPSREWITSHYGKHGKHSAEKFRQLGRLSGPYCFSLR